MSQVLSLTYPDAVSLLSGDSQVVKRLDAIIGLGLIAAAPAAPAAVLPLFDAKNEVISRLSELTKGLRERALRSNEIDRRNLYSAAHAVIVMVSFVEELSSALAKIDSNRRWRKAIRNWNIPQTAAQSGNADRARNKYVRIVQWANRTTIELPAPTRPVEVVQKELVPLYRQLGAEAIEFLSGLQIWSELSKGRQLEIQVALVNDLPEAAVRRYSANYLRLAGDVPEFLAWILSNDAQAVRVMLTESYELELLALRQMKRIERSIADLEQYMRDDSRALAAIPLMLDYLNGLAAVPGALAPAGARGTLDIHHDLQREALRKPLVAPEVAAVPAGLSFPTVADGYVNPRFRVSRADTPNDQKLLAQEHWWSEQTADQQDKRPAQRGLGAFLVTHVTTPAAASTPLVILGHPGSGKSLFSKVIAAQLPSDRYAVVTVPLRDADPAMTVYGQVDKSLQEGSNGSYGWRELRELVKDLAVVVVLDGLDELLQLSGVEELVNYLKKVEEFQEIETTIGSPTVAIVTARTLVMERIYVPPASVFIKLEDFDQGQIGEWLTTWNDVNAKYFADNNLMSCSPDTILRHDDLARQPLLLMMLALYDAKANSLRDDERLSKVDLYEGLFAEFARREVSKSPAVRKELFAKQVEERVDELSQVALALFNCGSGTISGRELDEDLRRWNIVRRTGRREPVAVTSDMILGQFFFLYRPRSTNADETIEYGYEFLHPTFGEFLVTRSLYRALAETLTQIGHAGHTLASDDQVRTVITGLERYLSRRPIVSEDQIIDFLRAMSRPRSGGTEASFSDITEIVQVLLRTVGALTTDARTSGSHDASHSLVGSPYAAAVWSLNLVLTALTIRGESVELGADVLGPSPLDGWRRLTDLWRYALRPSDWDVTIEYFSVAAGEAEDDVVILTAKTDDGISLASASSEQVRRATRDLLTSRLRNEFTREAPTATALTILKALSSSDATGGGVVSGASREVLIELAEALSLNRS
jgi:hypothetical protein